jgi:hypothetical protein
VCLRDGGDSIAWLQAFQTSPLVDAVSFERIFLRRKLKMKLSRYVKRMQFHRRSVRLQTIFQVDGPSVFEDFDPGASAFFADLPDRMQTRLILLSNHLERSIKFLRFKMQFRLHRSSHWLHFRSVPLPNPKKFIPSEVSGIQMVPEEASHTSATSGFPSAFYTPILGIVFSEKNTNISLTPVDCLTSRGTPRDKRVCFINWRYALGRSSILVPPIGCDRCL